MDLFEDTKPSDSCPDISVLKVVNRWPDVAAPTAKIHAQQRNTDFDRFYMQHLLDTKTQSETDV